MKGKTLNRLVSTGVVLASVVALSFAVLSCGSSSSEGGQRIQVSLTDEGCDPAAIEATAGKTTFVVTNKGAGGVTELEILDGNHVIGEVENVVPGLKRNFSINLEPGSYTLLCPGGSKNAKGMLTVTGTATKATPSGPVTTVDVAEQDFSIAPATTSGPSGSYAFNIKNSGPTTHEFVIIKTELSADSLPIEGSEVNEDDSRLQHIDEVEDLATGAATSFSVDLAAGHYAFICNISGHYQLGMHADFTVQ
jgi:uncharacterized cupredoxin-like copper-binding protein